MEQYREYPEFIRQAFSDSVQQLNGLQGSVLHGLRQDAWNYLQDKGIPTTRHEEWKYLNMIPILYNPGIIQNRVITQFPEELENYHRNIAGDALKIVVWNGCFSADLSDAIPSEVQISTISQIIASDHPLKNRIGQICRMDSDSFAALNTAFLEQSGLVIQVKPNIVLEKPIHILFVSAGHHDPALQSIVQPRIFIHLGHHAQAKVLQSFIAHGQGAVLTNTVAEAIVEDGALLEQYILQDYQDNVSSVYTAFTDIGRDAHNSVITISINGGIIRNTFTARLLDTGGTADFYGAVYGGGRSIIDNHTVVDHAAPHCESNELYKHVLADKATGIFNGKIFVRKDAQKTNAYQSNRTVLLSPGAQINSKPQLEILADDVKCSHGAISGALDPEQIFYLRARGISEIKAKALLLHAFIGEIADKIPFAGLQEHLDKRVSALLHQDDKN